MSEWEVKYNKKDKKEKILKKLEAIHKELHEYGIQYLMLICWHMTEYDSIIEHSGHSMQGSTGDASGYSQVLQPMMAVYYSPALRMYIAEKLKDDPLFKEIVDGEILSGLERSAYDTE